MQLKSFVPPIIIDMIRRSRQNKKLYDSCEKTLAVYNSGYEENDLIAVVFEKTKLYRDCLLTYYPFVSEITSLRTLVRLNLASRGKELNVIDFGSACGDHYFVAKIVFGERLNLRWYVVETPKMISWAVESQYGHLEFFDDLQKTISGFDHIDLVFSSSTLQYIPRPYDVLQQLVECRADNIFMARLGLSSLPKELIIVQNSHLSTNGPGPMPKGIRDRILRYPATFVRKDKTDILVY